MFGRKGELHPMYGKPPSAETRAKSRVTQGTAIFVYSLDDTLINSFNSVNEAKKFLNCCHRTIKRYIDTGELFRNRWIFFFIACLDRRGPGGPKNFNNSRG
jgi:group I intron endonuclease